jgi:hypothetical protein
MTPLQTPERREVLYCAGPYTATANHTKAQNIIRAMEQGQELRRLGLVPLVPHAAILPQCTWEEGMDECLELLRRADGVVLLEDWQESKGALQEKALAEALNMTVLDGIAAVRAEAEQGLPVSTSGRHRRFWQLLDLQAASEERAGAMHPSKRPGLWIIKAGLWVVTMNPTPTMAQIRATGQVIPSGAAALEYAGRAVGMVDTGGADFAPDALDMFPQLLRVLERQMQAERQASV